MKKRMSMKAVAVTAAMMMQIASPICAVNAETVPSDEDTVVSFEAEASEGTTVAVDSTNFPDAAFRQYVSDNFDTNKDGKLSQAERAEMDYVNIIDVKYSNISSLEGIEYFTNLRKLYCSYNQLTSLDVSKNTALEVLQCNDNKLTSLDVSKNTALKSLDCSYNQLTSLDVSKNTALTKLNCNNNQLTSLDVSKNTALELLGCSYNQIKRLDVSKNTALTTLYCYYNQLTSLDVSKNTALEYLSCDYNIYPIVPINGSFSLSSLPAGFDPDKASEWNGATYDSATNSLKDITGDTVTYTYDCGNGYTENFTLVVKGNNDDTSVAINEDSFPDETFRQYVSDNFDTDKDGKLSQAEMDDVTIIKIAGTSGARGTVKDLTGIGYFTKLKGLDCRYNQLTSLDMSKNKALKSLDCDGNQLTNLNVSKNTALESLYCPYNYLISLDVSKNTALGSLDCSYNQLTSLDVSKNMALWFLSCYNNQLTSLDMSKNTALRSLYCYNNQLTSLDLSKNTDLGLLQCYNNQLKSLDLSKNTDLELLHCSHNQLKSLDLSKNTDLRDLICSYNKLTSLDLSKNAHLYRSFCGYHTYPIVPINGSFSLSSLPAGFDPKKASEWTGASYDSATNSLKDITSDTITYRYECGHASTIDVTLKCKFVEIGNITVNSDSVVVTYTDNSSESYSFNEVPEAVVDFMINNDMKSCAAFVNAFSEGKDTMILTSAELKAVEAVLERDCGV